MRSRLTGWALLAVLALGAQTARVHADTPRTAHADIIDSGGHHIGRATFTEAPDGVEVSVTVHDLKPGLHGIHIHAVGKADPPAFTTAGGHFNPYHHQHGANNPNGSHVGDLPNLVVDASGGGHLEALAAGTDLGTTDHSLFHEGGTSLVIHAGPDDEKTDPSGNSGARIAAGVIERDR